MKKKEKKLYYEILVAATAIAIALIFGYWYTFHNEGGGILNRFSNLKKFTGQATQISFSYPKTFSVTEEKADSGSYIQIATPEKKAIALMKQSDLPNQFTEYEGLADAMGVTADARNYKDIEGVKWFVHYDNLAQPTALIFAAVKGRTMYQIVINLGQEEGARKELEEVIYQLIETIEYK